MEKVLLKTKTQWTGWVFLIVLLTIPIMSLLSNYYFLTIIAILPLTYVAYFIPYSCIFLNNQIITKTILKTTEYNYEDIEHVNLDLPNSRIGHILIFKLSNNRKFSIDYQNKYWTEDLCNLLLKKNIQINNNDFVWLKSVDGLFSAENFYPRTELEIKRKNDISEL